MSVNAGGLRVHMSSRLKSLLGLGGLTGSTKHDHYTDFGWPEDIDYSMMKRMWERNPLARSAVESHVEKVWESDPEVFEGEEAHEETSVESLFKAWASDIRLWQKLSEADRRSMVGDYSALILQVADGLPWTQPMGKVRSLSDVWDVIPCWEDELVVSEWDMDQSSRRYGDPITYTYQERQRTTGRNQPPVKSMTIHHTRVLVWSNTGSLDGRSLLRPGYNSLLDVEKVMGGGAEGFWKNARSSMTLDINPDSNMTKLAQALGVTPDKLGDKLNEVADDFSRGFDKALVTQGITATPISVTMPQPEEFQDGPIRMFATSVRIPVRVLIGNTTGERASTEDEKAWAKRCNGLRQREKIPLIKAMLNRFEQCGALPSSEWFIDWLDLTEGTSQEKMDSAKVLADINSAMAGTGEVAPFTSNEIREAAGYDAEDEYEEGVEEDLEDPAVQTSPVTQTPISPEPGQGGLEKPGAAPKPKGPAGG